jgi:hypothetical protein
VAVGALLGVAVSVRPRHTAAGSDTVPLDLGPYHIEIPVAFSPEIGMPGDPRRSRYVFMTIPIERLGLKPPPHLAMHAVANVVASLQLDGSDENRLGIYRSIPWTAEPENAGRYIGHGLKSGLDFYAAIGGQHPAYFVCPWFLGHSGGGYPMICNTEETLSSAGHDLPDLTLKYAFREDYYPVIDDLSERLRSLIDTFVTIKFPE